MNLTNTARVPENVNRLMDQRYRGQQVTVLHLPYYSTIRFGATVAGVIDGTTRRAFGYAVGQSATPGGFAATFGTATEAETNLQIASQTLGGADVIIWGIAAHVTPDSEPAYARRVWRETFLELAIGSNTTLPLGTLEMIPGAGGLRGVGQSAIKLPAIASPGMAVDGGAGTPFGFVENGESTAGNYYPLTNPIIWSGVAGGVDSSFNILATPKRAITETVAAARAAAAGVAAFTPPAAVGDLGTYVDVRFRLICVSVSKRSGNV